MGAPKRAVTALIGSVRFAMGSCDKMSHTNIRKLPSNRVDGRIVLWFTVPNKARAKWGITTPTNAMGL